jgi:GNAT superfamily N-acetyltransferase
MDDSGLAVAMRDGSRVVVRPVHPGDRALLLAGFERLGPESRYRRFLAAMTRLTGDFVTYLTDVDHHDHEALAAIDPETGDGVGVARFVRCRDRPDTAEAAVTVIDDWQGRGVGTALLDLLAERARAEGVVRFTALLLAENRRMLNLLEALGPVHVVDRQSGTVEIEAELPPTGAGRELHGVLGASARGPVGLAVRQPGEAEQLPPETRRRAPAERERGPRRRGLRP